MYVLSFTDIENLREEMIGFHKLGEKQDRNSIEMARTEVQREFYRGHASAHNNMVDFWKNVRLIDLSKGEEI